MREPVAVTELSHLKGLKINLGPEGTGIPKLFRQVLALNGVEPADLLPQAGRAWLVGGRGRPRKAAPAGASG